MIEYSDTSGSLWQFKRDEQNMNDNGSPADVTTADSSFKYKPSILGNPDNNGVLRYVKIVLPLRYLSHFFRLLEIPLINCKIHLEFYWTKNCVMSNIARVTTSKITMSKLYVPIVTFQLRTM